MADKSMVGEVVVHGVGEVELWRVVEGCVVRRVASPLYSRKRTRNPPESARKIEVCIGFVAQKPTGWIPYRKTRR